MEEKDLEDFFNKIQECFKEEKNKAEKEGTKFNIFDILGVSCREVYMCRLIAELLDPEGCHYQGSKYLELFYKTINIEKMPSKNVKVEKEECLDKNYRRIDITIDDIGNKCYLPIEVKIYANDQKNQCRDYLNKAIEKYDQKQNAKLFYLTIDGHKPSDESLGNLTTNEQQQIIYISWKNDIINWLNSCKNLTPETAVSIREILGQSIRAIEKFSNNERGEIMDVEVKKYLLENKDNMEMAIKIQESLSQAIEELWHKFYDKIKPVLINEGIKPQLDNRDWCLDYKDRKEHKHLNISANHSSNIKTGTYTVAISRYEEKNGKDRDIEMLYSSTLDNKEVSLSEFADEKILDSKVNKYIEKINEILNPKP